MIAPLNNPEAQRNLDNVFDLTSILNAVFLIALTAVALIAVNIVKAPLGISALSVLVLLGLLIIFFAFYRQGHVRLAGIGLILSISVVVTYNFIIGGGIFDNAMVIFPVLIIVTGLILGRNFIPLTLGIVLIEVFLIYGLTTYGIIAPFDGAVIVHFHNFLAVSILIIITGIVIWITVFTIENKIQQLIDQEINLRRTYDLTIDGWGNALELFDRDTEGHSLRVTELSLQLASNLGFDREELENIRRGALLHDIGKMGVPDELLNKKGPLDEKERSLIEMHPLHAFTLLKGIPFLEDAMNIPLYHHECWDGTGYPYQLSGSDIPLEARIFAIVDNWDALLSDRPYRKAWPREKVRDYLTEEKGKKFDPELVDLFLASGTNPEIVKSILSTASSQDKFDEDL